MLRRAALLTECCSKKGKEMKELVLKINNLVASDEVCCSRKVLQSDLIPFLRRKRRGIKLSARINIMILVMYSFISCNNTLYEEVFRTMSDPFSDVPEAESFLKENTVYLSWKEDAGADEYYLMRAGDGDKLQFKCVYRGKGTNYTDEDLQNGSRYVYRLDKTRGKKYFVGEKYGYGINTSIFGGVDSYGDNDREESATYLERDRIDIMAVAQFYDGSYICDEDWYYVILKARRKAVIILENTTGNVEHSPGEQTHFKYTYSNSTAKEIRNLTAFEIVNETDIEKRIAFKLFCDTTSLFPFNIGDTVLSYRLSLKTIEAYP